MNRRTAIRKAIGLGVGAAALPVLSKTLEANDPINMASCMPSGSYPVPPPPPPDMRTPEQILADQDLETAEDVIRHLTRIPDQWSKRYGYQLWGREFGLAKALLHERQIPITERIIGGSDCLIGPNGNVVRRIEQPLYLA